MSRRYEDDEPPQRSGRDFGNGIQRYLVMMAILGLIVAFLAVVQP